MAKNKHNRVAPEITPEEAAMLLDRVGATIKRLREARTKQDAFAYEIGISRSQMNSYESGGDMKLSTFFKLLHGLEISPTEFFKAASL